MLTDKELDALEALAKAAKESGYAGFEDNNDIWPELAAYWNAANPAAVLELVRELKVAREATQRSYGHDCPIDEQRVEQIRVKERSRYAAIADKTASSLKCSDWDDDLDYDAGFRAACRAIAKEIREGDKP
jgi:sugar phosphate isomerase/epimerase